MICVVTHTLSMSLFVAEGSELGSSSGEEEEGEEEEEEGGVEEWMPSGPKRALGDWEKYTTVSAPLLCLILTVDCRSLLGNRLQANGQDGLCRWVSNY